MVDVENAYDRFSRRRDGPGGRPGAHPPRRARGGAKYVLLIGDDTFDPRDFSGTGEVSYIPSLLGWDGEYGRVPSENRYADLNGDGAPELAIGRLPVQTAEEADVHGGQDRRARRKCCAARARATCSPSTTRPRATPPSAARRRAVATLLGAEPTCPGPTSAGGIDQARADLLGGLAAGPLATHYFGHGSVDFWADENLLDAERRGGLAPDGRETVLFAWTCVSQNYLCGRARRSRKRCSSPRGRERWPRWARPGSPTPGCRAALFARLYPQLLGGVPAGRGPAASQGRDHARQSRRASGGRGMEPAWAIPPSLSPWQAPAQMSQTRRPAGAVRAAAACAR